MAKIDTIREKFKNKIKPIDFIELANNIDNSKTKKYTEHLVRFTNNLSSDFEITAINEMEYILEILNKFDELATNGLIEKPDLNQYKNLSTVKQSIKDATFTKSIGKAKKEIKILYEDDKYMLFLPLSYDAASVYGRGTKWCVTQSEYYYRYTDKGILAYFVEKDINRKIGLYYDMNESYYYSVLKTKNPNEFQLGGLKSKSIMDNDEEEVKYDSEMREMFNFSNKFSCWTDWDVKMEMMFVPIPLNIKELFINYCKENNIQNASLMDETETDNLINQYEGRKNEFGYDDREPERMPPMEEMIMDMEGGMPTMETIQGEVYENNVGENYEF
jgi:hypothetical protein